MNKNVLTHSYVEAAPVASNSTLGQITPKEVNTISMELKLENVRTTIWGNFLLIHSVR